MPHEGTTIRIAREAQDLSLRELARLAGVDHAYLSKVERGLVNRPTQRWLDAVTRALGENLARRSAA